MTDSAPYVHREEWEEVSFQVFTDEGGALRSGYYPTGNGTVTGNVQVDRVWGNIPMQPDADRSYASTSFGGGAGDVGWNSTVTIASDTLDTGDYSVGTPVQNLFFLNVPADSHTIATTGYSNFPEYIPNYAGDGDAKLETVIPNIMRKTIAEADDLLYGAHLNAFFVAHNPNITYITSTDKTVRVTVDDLVGIRSGDQVWVSTGAFDFYSGDYYNTVSVVTNVDTESGAWFEFEYAGTIDPALDDTATGTVWAGPNLVNVITVIQPWNPVGATVNENTNIHARYVGE